MSMIVPVFEALGELRRGQITSIAADGSLSLNAPNAYLADAGATTSWQSNRPQALERPVS